MGESRKIGGKLGERERRRGRETERKSERGRAGERERESDRGKARRGHTFNFSKRSALARTADLFAGRDARIYTQLPFPLSRVLVGQYNGP